MKFWYTDSALKWLFWPLHTITAYESKRRRHHLKKGVEYCDVPIIVVGNVTVGGTGKTPIVIALVKYFQSLGLEVGVVSRGYGSQAKTFPLEVDSNTHSSESGDEPKLIRETTDCRVVIAPERDKALKLITTPHEFLKPVDIIISDDGLQHYALPRWKEIVVIDANRQFGNGLCLPAGPLREPVDRLYTVDYIIESGDQRKRLTSNQFGPTHARAKDTDILGHYAIKPTIGSAINLRTHQQKPLSAFKGESVHAMAAIGQPEKFFEELERAGLKLQRHPFSDHYQYSVQDIPKGTLLMTEKDAVKCELFASDDMWFVPLEVELPSALLEHLKEQLNKDYPDLNLR